MNLFLNGERLWTLRLCAASFDLRALVRQKKCDVLNPLRRGRGVADPQRPAPPTLAHLRPLCFALLLAAHCIFPGYCVVGLGGEGGGGVWDPLWVRYRWADKSVALGTIYLYRALWLRRP